MSNKELAPAVIEVLERFLDATSAATAILADSTVDPIACVGEDPFWDRELVAVAALKAGEFKRPSLTGNLEPNWQVDHNSEGWVHVYGFRVTADFVLAVAFRDHRPDLDSLGSSAREAAVGLRAIPAFLKG